MSEVPIPVLSVPVVPVPALDAISLRQVRSDNLKGLNKSRPMGAKLKEALTSSRGRCPGSPITLIVSPKRTKVGQDAFHARKLIDQLGLITDGGKKKRRRRRRTKKKRRKRNLKKRTRRRRRKSKRRRRR